jgi:hypothetical protein
MPNSFLRLETTGTKMCCDAVRADLSSNILVLLATKAVAMNAWLPAHSLRCCGVVRLRGITPSGGTQAKRLKEKVTEPCWTRTNKSYSTSRLTPRQ